MAGILTYIIKFCVDFKVDDGIKKNIEGHWFWQLEQPRTQALHCFYRDQRQLIIQARMGARSTRDEGSAWQKMQIFVVTYRISCF